MGVGTNLGDRFANIDHARRMLEDSAGVAGIRASQVYETDPAGGPPQGKYLNAVFELETELTPRKLMALLLKVEKDLGRVRGAVRNEPRLMDLDLLACGDAICLEDGLVVPHPRMHERYFVLKPMSDLAPEWVHPVIGRSIRQLLETLDERI